MKPLNPLLLALAGVAGLPSCSGGGADDGPRTVRAVRGDLLIEAVAVGQVEAAFAVPVKSANAGVVTRRFVELGQRVVEGDPLFEVRPVLTDLQRLQAERALLEAREAEEGVQELTKGETLAGVTMRLFQGEGNAERMARASERARSDAEEQLELLLNGSAEIDGKVIDYLVRAPIDGHVVALDLEVGEPVVPSSSYGSGTELLTLADLAHPVFRGTVDEIDVGRLREGMRANLTLGALPQAEVSGTLTEIGLLATTRSNATVFPIELAVEPPADLVLRSGYSAVARIVVEEARDVLLLPERVVEYRDGSAVVRLAADGSERAIEVGLSDGMQVVVLSGLEEGEDVLDG